MTGGQVPRHPGARSPVIPILQWDSSPGAQPNPMQLEPLTLNLALVVES
jgi:hypothetical protein